MNLYAILSLCFIPTVICFFLFVIFNSELKVRFCLLSSAFGIATVLPASLIQFFLMKIQVFNNSSFYSVIITALVFNGLIEETMKMFVLCLLPQKKLSLSAFLCCSILFGLALGGFESVIYFIKRFSGNNLNIAVDFGDVNLAVRFIVQRIFSAGLVHSFCAGLCGLYVWSFKTKNQKIIPFLYAVVLHGIYNFFIAFQSNYRYLAAVAIIFAAVELRNWYLEVKKD